MANSETRSLKGTNPWTRLSAVFQTPEDASELVVECQFGSGSPGTVEGKAWIDDVKLEALPDKVLHTKRVVIDTKSPLKKYDPMIFGGFIEHFQDQIYGGLFEPGSPLSDERGFRKDVIAAMRELKLSVVRWPGGCFVSGYHWKDGVGKTRTPVPDPVWGVTDPNTFGTDEFVEWCRLVGCEPYICTNAGNGTPEEMKQWVEYCNATEGEYAAQRKANGHEKPFNVKFWSIGNENYGPWEIGRKDAKDWGPLVDLSAGLMLEADPGIILAAAATKKEDWSLPLLAAAGKRLQYIAVHEYWLGYWSKNAMPAYKDCPLYVHPEGIVKRTTFHTMALYANEIGSHLVPADTADGRNYGTIAAVDAIVTTTPGSKKLKVLLINRDPSAIAGCLVKIDDQDPVSGDYPAVILTADSPEAFNSVETPERVRPKRITAHFDDGATQVPPHSMVIITLECGD